MSHGGLNRARSWKRRIQPKKAYRSPGLLYSESGEKACLHQLSQRCDSSGKKTLLQFLTYACVLLPLGDLATVYRLTVKFFSAAQVVHEMSPHLLGARALVTHSVHSEVLNLSHDASEQRRSDFIGSEVCHWPQSSNARRETNVTNVQKICRVMSPQSCLFKWGAGIRANY